MMSFDPDGENRQVSKRTQASLHGSRSRDVPRGSAHRELVSMAGRRVKGTNGSFPATSADPKPPAICALYNDLLAPEQVPEAVFGQYPVALIPKVLPWLRCRRNEVLHVCSGSLKPREGIRVDVRAAARPDVLADGRSLPFTDGSIAAVMLDPPYTVQYAQDLYGVDYPRPSHLLREAARVVRPCGRIAFVHYLVPMPPPGCAPVRVLGLSTGFGFPMRAVTIFEREQDSLLSVGSNQ